MELKACYQNLGGDFNDAVNRLRREQLVQKFMLKFLDDPSFSQLQAALESQNNEEAFRAAHTLKGVCQNLAFTRLYHSSFQLTQALRAGDEALAAVLFPSVQQDYAQTVKAITEFKKSLESTKP